MEIIKLCDESENIFLLRKEFISKAKKKDNTLSDGDLIKYSKIWANIRFKGCKYSPKIYKKIRLLTNDLKRKIEDYVEENSDSED
tara:strand:- start:16 stop:270 length:255 start_codon:yes stop_codon:yes gene_type:complete